MATGSNQRGGKHRPGVARPVTQPARTARTAQVGTAGRWRFGRNGGRGRAFQRDGTKKKRGFFRRFWWVFVLVPLLAAAGLFGTLWYV